MQVVAWASRALRRPVARCLATVATVAIVAIVAAAGARAEPAPFQPAAIAEAAVPSAQPAAGSPSAVPAKGADPTAEGSADAEPLSTPGSALIPHDLSPYGMVMHADVVVKAVMAGLALASLFTWTILIAKAFELIGARATARRGLARLADAPTLHEAAAAFRARRTPVVRLVDAALAEAERSEGLPADGVKERAAALLARIESRAGRTMGRGTGLLATVGSTAPFVGLFGTVWGIMNSFIGISKTNTTNLAIVAPGIAEALLATATGLVAAIPAVIIYNLFAREITGYRQILGDASTEVLRLLSRDLDRDAMEHHLSRQAAE